MHTATEAVKYVKEKLQTRQEEKRETVHANAKKKIDSATACVVAEVQLLRVSSQ